MHIAADCATRLHLFDFRSTCFHADLSGSEVQGATRMAFSKHLQDFVAHALMAYLMIWWSKFTDAANVWSRLSSRSGAAKANSASMRSLSQQNDG